MKTLDFFAEGKPEPQPRPRATAINGKPRMYTPSTADAWKRSVWVATRNAMTAAGWERCQKGAVLVSLIFVFDRPKSHYTSKQMLKASAPFRHEYKPDLDNLVKAVLDAMTEAGAWKDDCQCVMIDARKTWIDNGRPGVGVELKMYS